MSPSSSMTNSRRQASFMVCNDNEEVGSMSAEGAQGPFLGSVLERWCGAGKGRAIARSMMISADNAHGVHPNFMDKHDENHGPILRSEERRVGKECRSGWGRCR